MPSTRLNWSINLNPNRLSPTLNFDELYANGDRAIEPLQDLGVQYLRLDLRWDLIEPEPGRISVEAIAWYRHFLERATLHGLSVFGILYSPPLWAQALALKDLEGFHQLWRAFCRRAALEFGDWIGLWQVWNEPNNYVSHLKDDFNFFHTRTFSLGPWRATLPVGVNWSALVPIFRIARQELGHDNTLAYNVIANVSEYTPLTYPGWTEWDDFTDQFMERAADCVDAIALDHYPDTWVPGVGPHHWTPLDILAKKVKDPRSAWYNKTALIGEFGYSSCRNVDLIRKPRIQFFPEDHSEETMRQWYAAVIPLLRDRMRPDHWPNNKIHLANIYELYDARPGDILGGEHADVVGIEYYFGLLKNTGEPKPAYSMVKELLCGTAAEEVPTQRRATTHPLRLYMQGSAVSKDLHRRIAPPLYALFQALRPTLRRQDASMLSLGAMWMLFQLWRAATRPGK